MDIRRATGDDKVIISDWLKAIDWNGLIANTLPSSTYIVYEGNTPIVGSFYFAHEESPVAFMGITIANPSVKGCKAEYVNALLDTLESAMKADGCTVCCYSTDKASSGFLDKYMRPRGFVFAEGFAGAKALNKKQDIDFIV